MEEKKSYLKRYIVTFQNKASHEIDEFVVLAFFPDQAIWSLVASRVKSDFRNIQEKQKREEIYKKYNISVEEKNIQSIKVIDEFDEILDEDFEKIDKILRKRIKNI